MNVTITGQPEGMTIQDLATRLYKQYGCAAEVEPIEPKPDRTSWTYRLAEIIQHIQDHDYGLAESKARILLDQIQKGDWTLGSETKTDHVDGGFVRMYCGAPDKSSEGDDTEDRVTLLEILKIVRRLNGSDARKDVRAIQSMKSVDILITAWGEQPDEDPIEERTCAFCGRDDPCVICGGDWFCDGKCADNHTANDTLLTNFKDSMIEGLSTELDYCKSERVRLINRINRLEAELSEKHVYIDGCVKELGGYRQDYMVLMRVVEIIQDRSIPNNKAAALITTAVKDYLDAPE